MSAAPPSLELYVLYKVIIAIFVLGQGKCAEDVYLNVGARSSPGKDKFPIEISSLSNMVQLNMERYEIKQEKYPKI